MTDYGKLSVSNLTSIAELKTDDVHTIFGVAAEMKRNRSSFPKVLQDKRLAMLFEKESLRTRVTFEVGMQDLGGTAVFLDHQEVRLGTREALKDVAGNLSRWCHGIVARTFRHRTVQDLANGASIPVINGLTDYLHPCQGLTDMFTLAEIWGDTEGKKVAFVGDGASNQGTTFESLNMAVVLNLPAIFVFENNYIGEGTGVDYAVGSRNIANRAAGFGLPVEKVDGCDFFAVHEAFGACAERARSGGGPSGFEVTAPRFYGHFEGDPQLYRGDGEVDDLRANRDCLKLFRRRVTEAGLLDAAALDEIEAAAHTEIETAVAVAREGAPPGPDDLMTDVYASAY